MTMASFSIILSCNKTAKITIFSFQFSNFSCLIAVPALAADKTITVTASQDWVKDAEQELGKKFEEETGIHVDYQIVPADQYQDLLLTRLNSGEGPDIFGRQSGFAIDTTYNVKENAVDLSGEEWIDAYSVFSREQTSVDGVNYGLT